MPDPRSDRVTWGELERGLGRARVKLTPTQELGYRLFVFVVMAIVVGFVAWVAYAWLTWPRGAELGRTLEGLSGAESAAILQQLRNDWHREIRQTAVTMFVGPLVPLLSAIIGYVLGRERSD